MKISREVKTGVLVILGIILFVFGFNYLKGQNLLDATRNFYVVYDNVEGLVPATPVTINGLVVGKVKSINFIDDNSGKLLVDLMVDSDFEFSKNSTAQLYDTGIIGGKAIAIIPAFDNAENAKRSDYLKASVKAGLTELVTQKLNPLQEKIELAMISADSLLTNLNDIFDAQTKANLKSSFAQLNATITSFKSTSLSINEIVTDNKDKLSNTLTNVDNISNNLSKVTDSIAQANLGKTIEDLQSTVANFDKMLSSIESGNGSIGKLMKDEKLYNNLEGASKQLEELLEDMKLNPKRYVHFSLFGKKAKRYDAEGNEIKEEK